MNFFRRSFLLSVSITFLLGYAVLDIGQFLVMNLAFYEDYQKGRIINVVNLAGLGEVLLEHNEVVYLEKRLQDALAQSDIDFYFIKKDGQIISYDSASFPVETVTARISDHLPGEKQLTGDMPHIAFRYGPYQLAVGLSSNRSNYIKILLQKHRAALLFDIGIVVLMVSLIAFFFFSDIRMLLQALRSPGKKNLSELKPVIAEANLMLRGIRSYESHLHQLQTKQGVLSRHIASALRTELDSGRTPPYQFRCTMVRTDINQYSTIYSEHPVEEFMAVINEFFSKSSKVIARYNGYVTDFVGDEIIYYFKDDDHENSAAIAAAAVRDINEIASELHLKTEREHGYPFRVKSAMACGSLRFGPHVNGFSLSGGAFVETVRILSQIEEKSENSVYLPSRLSSRLRGICDTELKKSVTLKGLPGLTELHKVSHFSEFSPLFDQLTTHSTSLLTYYRSAPAVISILKAAANASPDLAVAILKPLESISHPFSDEAVRDSYLSTIERFYSAQNSKEFPLSFLITLSRTLLSLESYDSRLQAMLERCLESSDRRVVANAVETWMHFDPNHQSEAIAKLLKHHDNRVVANTLIKMGILDMGRQVIQGLNQLLDSTEPKYIASGAYAAGILSSYHRATNPQLLETHLGFRQVMKKVRSLTSHPDAIVRHQALISQGKFKKDTLAA